MAQTKELNPTVKKYSKMGIIAGVVIVVALLGIWAISAARRGVSTETALKEVTETAVTGADLRIAVVSMEQIQKEATVLEDLHKQRASFENKLKSKLEKEQKAIEKEKKIVYNIMNFYITPFFEEDNYEQYRKDNGKDRCALQGQRLYFRGQRNLRRSCKHLGLRPSRRRA